MSFTSRLSSSQPATSLQATLLSTEPGPVSTRILTRELEAIGAALIRIMIAGLFGEDHSVCIWRGISILEHVESVRLIHSARDTNKGTKKEGGGLVAVGFHDEAKGYIVTALGV